MSIPWQATTIILVICVFIIAAGVADLRCTAIQPSGNTLILACSASRLPR